MSISVDCAICDHELDRPGAIVLGPPDDYGNTKKYHVCMSCWQKGPRIENIVAAVQDEIPEGMSAVCAHCRFKITQHPERKTWYRDADGTVVCGGRVGPPGSSVEHEPPSIDEAIRTGSSEGLEAVAAVYPHPFPRYCQVVMGTRTPGGTGDEVDITCGSPLVDGQCQIHDAPVAKPANKARARCRHCALVIEYVELMDDWTTGINGSIVDFICPVNRYHEAADPA